LVPCNFPVILHPQESSASSFTAVTFVFISLQYIIINSMYMLYIRFTYQKGLLVTNQRWERRIIKTDSF
jgi:hypothetical protein